MRKLKMKLEQTKFKFASFSKKQRKVIRWWCPSSPVKDYRGIIADGSIRSGKTLCISLSFVIWAMVNFNGCNFAMCGKTIGSFRRNVLDLLKRMLLSIGLFRYEEYRTDNLLVVSFGGNTNRFFLFGGKDEGSQDLIQGFTLAGVLFDEVALMPESFVAQAMARCSVEGAKYWFDCNPEHPNHWFHTEWIQKRKEKGLLYLHFDMHDNLTLSEEKIKEYESLYTGVFYERFVLGNWISASGLVYDMFTEALLYDDGDIPQGFLSSSARYIAVDYGTVNPMVFLEVYDDGLTSWVSREYYYSSVKAGIQKGDMQYVEDMESFTGDEFPDCILVDPSAASFKVALRARGYRVMDADNSVNDGIRMVSSLLYRGRIRIHKRCENLIREFGLYTWDEKAKERGVEQVIKQNDHAMDALRYYVKTIIRARRFADE